MRKSGWAVAAAGVSSLVLLLTACGGSSSSSSSAAGTSGSTPNTGGGPSAGATDLPSPGTQVLIVERSKLGWVLAEASGFVVYTYGGDAKGGSPTCTGSCAALWPAVTGLPQAGPADTLPGTLGTVTMSNGGKQITYNGYPLYVYKGSQPYTTTGNNVGGVWHVVMLSESDITG